MPIPPLRRAAAALLLLAAPLAAPVAAMAQSPAPTPLQTQIEAPAQTPFAAEIRRALEDGRSADAAALAEEALAADPGHGTARLALGVARFIGALEGLGQDFHRFGLDNSGTSRSPLSRAMLLRLPAPPNPAPEPVSYRGLRGALDRFAAGLADAEAALAPLSGGEAALTLDLAAVQLDMAPGAQGGRIPLLDAFQAVAGAISGRQMQAGLEVDFDAADAAWLQAYTHTLMAVTDILLAHDWERSYEATFHGLFPNSFTPATVLSAPPAAPAPQLKKPDCDPQAPGCKAELRRYLAERLKGGESSRAARNRAQMAGVADLIAFAHLFDWPVEDGARMASALAHLEAAVALSGETRLRVLAETDLGREWIPSPEQTGALTGMRMDSARFQAWGNILEEVSLVLKGERLVPHWRFEQGFNLRRMFLEPRRLDPVLLIQGSGIAPYLEDGPISHGATWRMLTSAFGRDFFAHAVWIN